MCATRCNTLQHAATRCDMLQHTAMTRTSFRHPTCVAVCCSVLRCVAVGCNVLQCAADQIQGYVTRICYKDLLLLQPYVASTICYNHMLLSVLCTKKYTATRYSILQHTATHCNTLQHTATHCNTLQHTAILALPKLFGYLWGGVFQCVAVCCSVLQCVAVCCLWGGHASVLHIWMLQCVLQCVAVCCSVCALPMRRSRETFICVTKTFMCVTHCNTHCNIHMCNTLQHTLTHSSILKHAATRHRCSAAAYGKVPWLVAVCVGRTHWRVSEDECVAVCWYHDSIMRMSHFAFTCDTSGKKKPLAYTYVHQHSTRIYLYWLMNKRVYIHTLA